LLNPAKSRLRKTLVLTAKVSVAFVLVLAGSSCGNGSASSSILRVSAASSLTDVFEEIVPAFESQNPDVEVRPQFAGSSQLATQIMAGAPVDVFAAANETVMAALLDDLSGSASTQFLPPQIFAQNELVIAVPADNPHNISGIQDIPHQSNSTKDIVLAVCAAEVPCGTLAEQAASQAGVVLRPNTYEANVRAVLAKLILGEVDVGLVYKSDVTAVSQSGNADEPRLEYIAISPAPIADYPVAARADNPMASAFVEFLRSHQAQQIFSSYGFKPLNNIDP